MGTSSYRDVSDDDYNDDEEDMELLKRVFKSTGINPADDMTVTGDASASISSGDSETEDEEDGEIDDLELVRKIQEKFPLSSSEEVVESDTGLLVLKALKTVPPSGLDCDDGDEDDIETLDAIKRRFSKYKSDVVQKNVGSQLDKSKLLNANDAATSGEIEIYEEACRTSQPLQSLVDTACPSSVEWHSFEGCESLITLQSQFKFRCPKSAHFFIDAIKKNRLAQKFIRSKMIQLEARIEENTILKKRIKLLKDFQIACRKRAGRDLSQKKDAKVQLISACKTKRRRNCKDRKVSALSFGPVQNSRVATYREVLELFPITLHRNPWTNSEKENLVKGIIQQFQEMLLWNSDMQNSDTGESADDSRAMLTVIRNHDSFISFLPKVDWDRLASTYVVGRSGAECQASFAELCSASL